MATMDIDDFRYEIKRTLDAAAKLCPTAHSVALTLLSSDMSLREIREAVKKIPASVSDSVHYRGRGICGSPAADEGPAEDLHNQIAGIAKAASGRTAGN